MVKLKKAKGVQIRARGPCPILCDVHTPESPSQRPMGTAIRGFNLSGMNQPVPARASLVRGFRGTLIRRCKVPNESPSPRPRETGIRRLFLLRLVQGRGRKGPPPMVEEGEGTNPCRMGSGNPGCPDSMNPGCGDSKKRTDAGHT